MKATLTFLNILKMENGPFTTQDFSSLEFFYERWIGALSSITIKILPR